MEHLITITLSPSLLRRSAKKQLKLTLCHIKSMFKSGKCCIEFTKQANVHYHIKTQDAEDIVYCAVDQLKEYRYMDNGKKQDVFGFTKMDKTQHREQIENYDYILKDYQRTECILKRLKIKDKDGTYLKAVYDYTDKTPRPGNKQIDLRKYCCLESGAGEIDSDTELEINKIKLI